MNVRKITPAEMPSIHFAHNDVLRDTEDRQVRNAKLRKAMLISNLEHEDVGIIFQLESGEVIETFSSVIDYADDYVELKGGYTIPVSAIVDVES
jgi:hypothetical protein